MKTFTVTLENPTSISDLQQLIKKFQESTSAVWTQLDLTNDDTKICTYISNESTATATLADVFSVGDDFDYNDWQSGNNIFLAVDNLYKYEGSTDVYDIEGAEFNVCAVVDSYLNDFSVIPLNSAEKYKAISVKIQLTETPTVSEITQIHYELKDLFSGEVTDPIERNYTLEESLNSSDILSYVMIAMALLSECYLFLYLWKKCEREYSIFGMLGCTAVKNTLYIYSSVMLLTALQMEVGDVIYMLVIKRIIKTIDPITALMSDIKCITFSAVTVIIAITAAFIPMILSVKNKRENIYLKLSHLN